MTPPRGPVTLYCVSEATAWKLQALQIRNEGMIQAGRTQAQALTATVLSVLLFHAAESQTGLMRWVDYVLAIAFFAASCYKLWVVSPREQRAILAEIEGLGPCPVPKAPVDPGAN